MDELGGKFWLTVVGISLAIGIGGMIIFFVIGAAWYRWGAIGALIFFGAVLLGSAWIWDKTHSSYDDEVVADT